MIHYINDTYQYNEDLITMLDDKDNYKYLKDKEDLRNADKAFKIILWIFISLLVLNGITYMIMDVGDFFL